MTTRPTTHKPPAAQRVPGVLLGAFQIKQLVTLWRRRRRWRLIREIIARRADGLACRLLKEILAHRCGRLGIFIERDKSAARFAFDIERGF